MSRLAQYIIIITLPVFLLLTSVRLVMTPAFLRYEYGQPDFPAAKGLSPAERLNIAEITLAYVKSRTDLETLRQLPYQDREVKHLIDVQVLTRQAFAVHELTGGLLLIALLLLSKRPRTRLPAARALLHGSGLTLLLLGALALLVYANFNWFFVTFHRLFFEGDSWQFDYSDTLIRVFPVPFWFDASLGLALLTIGEAIGVGIGAFIWMKREYAWRIHHET